MTKEKYKKNSNSRKKTKYKTAKNKVLVKESTYGKPITSISKKEFSSNWLSFMKSNGVNGRVFNIKKTISNEEEQKKKVTNARTPIATKVLALDCEMVSDLDNQDMLARVSLVNYKLECIYDKYVKPTSKVGDYRTRFSGIREEDLDKGEVFEDVRREVKAILFNKILVGHALHNDFKVLKFGHHKQLIRDTSQFDSFREVGNSKTPSLKKLAKIFLNENIQEGEHNSVEDAKTTMKLYKKFRQEWEVSIINSKFKKLEKC